MQLAVGIGNSNLEDGYAASMEAVSLALETLGPGDASFAFVFCTIGYEQEDVLEAVTEKLGDVPMSGATFEGIIGRGFADESMYAVQVVLLRSDTIRFHSFCAGNGIEHPLEAGEYLGRQVAEVGGDGNRVLFLFPDFRMNVTRLFEGIENHCVLPFIGGVSGDNLHFQQCYQFYNGEAVEAACSAVLMVGDFELKTIVTHGSEPLGGRAVVTRSEGTVIYEIDGMPALEFASRAFGEAITPENIGTAIPLMGVGLLIEDSAESLSPYVLRAIHGFDFASKSCTVPTEVPEGTEIEFMRRDPRSVVESGRAGARQIQRGFEPGVASPKLVCQFDCAGRGKCIVGDEVLSGVEMIQRVFDENVPWMGSFAFGEISPVDQRNFFHNFTATLAVFY